MTEETTAGRTSGQDGREKKVLQWYFLGRLLVITLLLGVSLIIESGSATPLYLPARYLLAFIAFLYLYTLVSALVLKKLSRPRTFAALQLMADTAMITLLVMVSGGSQTIFTAIYFFPIITASFIFRRPTGTLFIAALATMSYGLALILEYFEFGWFLPFWKSPLSDFMTVLHFFSIHGLLFFLVAGLSIFLAERMRSTENELSRSSIEYGRLQTLYRQVFNDITTGIITLGEDNRITSMNPAASSITGYSLNDISGRRINDIFPGFEFKQDGGIRTVVDLTRADGKVIPVGFTWARLNMPDACDDCRVITMQDLSKIKEMEAKVMQVEKMATIGEMAAGIAHDFRNPLAAMSGAAQVLAAEIEEGSAESRLMEIITRECQRMENTITDFLRFSKPAPPEPDWFSLSATIDEIITMFSHTRDLGHAADRISNLVPRNLDCWADPDQARHLLMNLIGNAATFAGSGDAAAVAVSAVEEETEDGDVIRITVEDNGPGIPVDLREKIFEPFFTTRESGTGLGLAIVRQIVESHHGRIMVESEPGRTAFTVTLPLPSE